MKSSARATQSTVRRTWVWFNLTRCSCVGGALLFALCLVTSTAASAQTFNSIFSFSGNDGNAPDLGTLVQGTDGSFYGTTGDGGANEGGTIYKITPTGELTTLYNFCSQTNCVDGNRPFAGLFLGTDGNFYGTTLYGGANNSADCEFGCGTLFRITPQGALTTLYNFCSQPNCADGAGPHAPLMQALNGELYGTTGSGGLNNSYCPGCGTLFKTTLAGKLTTLHLFCSETNCADGKYPVGGLVQTVNGDLYGTTWSGGVGGYGTVFNMTTWGKLTPIHSFSGRHSGGMDVGAGLVRAADGNFYGDTSGGGTAGFGTIFEITPYGESTTLLSFIPYLEGGFASDPLIQGTDGNFYGTTFEGSGRFYYGSAFQMTPDGSLTPLYAFDPVDGTNPAAGLLQSTNGTFYGTTNSGGSSNNCYEGCGTVFSVSMNLGPFVAFVMRTAQVGRTVEILGQGFTDATRVSFHGTSAPFTVVSDTFLKASVPAGATTGPVTVTTPSGTLTSNVDFWVHPQLLSFSPPNGPVGTQVTITGVSFKQTVGVGFGDRVPAQFTVNSDTQITAIVPSGAKTGKIGVVTKGGTAISSGTFTVN